MQPNIKPHTLTRADLSEAIYAHCPGLSHQQARALLDAVLDEMIDALAQGGSLQLRTFGTFEVRRKRERLGRNPRTGVAAPISARRVVTFSASPILIAKMNGAATDAEERSEESGKGGVKSRSATLAIS